MNTPPQREPWQEAIEAEFPLWHTWTGVVPGLLYARRPRSSPPKVTWAATPAELRDNIAAWQLQLAGHR